MMTENTQILQESSEDQERVRQFVDTHEWRLSTKNSRKLITRQLGLVVRHKSDNLNQRITLAAPLLTPCCPLADSLLSPCWFLAETLLKSARNST